MSAEMLKLQENWLAGTIICISVVVIFYVLWSVLSLLHHRKVGRDVGVICFVPVVNLFYGVFAKARESLTLVKIAKEEALAAEKAKEADGGTEAVKAEKPKKAKRLGKKS